MWLQKDEIFFLEIFPKWEDLGSIKSEVVSKVHFCLLTRVRSDETPDAWNWHLLYLGTCFSIFGDFLYCSFAVMNFGSQKKVRWSTFCVFAVTLHLSHRCFSHFSAATTVLFRECVSYRTQKQDTRFMRLSFFQLKERERSWTALSFRNKLELWGRIGVCLFFWKRVQKWGNRCPEPVLLFNEFFAHFNCDLWTFLRICALCIWVVGGGVLRESSLEFTWSISKRTWAVRLFENKGRSWKFPFEAQKSKRLWSVE